MLKKKMHFVKWTTMCMETTKGVGGGMMSIRCLSLLNKVFLCKWNDGMQLKEDRFGIRSLVENMGRKRRMMVE